MKQIENQEEIQIYIPQEQCIIFLQNGSGDQLSQEDYENGYDAYIDYTESRFDENSNAYKEYDGGLFLYASERYENYTDAIPDFIRYVTGKEECPNLIVLPMNNTNVVVLNKGEIEAIDQKNKEYENECDMER